MKSNRKIEMEAFKRLLDVMDELRERCPWDREQTMESLRPLTIEETYELSEAIMDKDDNNIAKELGDILLHIVFYAKIGSEKGTFNIVDVINMLCDKLIYRHPHVFSNVAAEDSSEVIKNWEQLKQTEKDGNKTILSGVPDHLPPLLKAYRMQDKARAVGFDWEYRDQVWDKVEEEIGEFKVELNDLVSGDTTAEKRAENELGDLLFAIVNASRLYGLNPDTALESTNKRFKARFGYLEKRSKELGVALKDMTLAEMDVIWDEAKKQLDGR